MPVTISRAAVTKVLLPGHSNIGRNVGFIAGSPQHTPSGGCQGRDGPLPLTVRQLSQGRTAAFGRGGLCGSFRGRLSR